MTDVPVLLLAFNRPDLTRVVMDRIRVLAPRRLFVALDGPRPGEEERCDEVHRIVTAVDWRCELQVLRRDSNLGCRMAVTGAIDWFFDRVEAGMIVEDDILVSPSFATYCAALLDRYADDERVWMISGVNLVDTWPGAGASYHFGHGGIWGWATWRRAWQHNDIAMRCWDDAGARARARAFLGEDEWRHLAPRFEAVRSGLVDTWDYQWSFARAQAGGLSAIPAVNLVRNLGFGVDATHTFDASSPFARLPLHDLEPPLVHPDDVEFDRDFQRRVTRAEHPPALVKVRRRLARAAAGVVR